MKKLRVTFIGFFLLSPFCLFSNTSVWLKADSIVANIKVPVFKNKTYRITQYGAVADGETDCTAAFRKAIETCNKKGGGRVVVSEGKYLTGAIHLLSNVNLHLEEGAEILFSRDSKKYLPIVRTRFGGIDLMNYSPFVYAFEQENIAITGKGTLNGQANDSTWWHWNGWGKREKLQSKASNLLYQYAQKGIPVEDRVFGEGSYIRPNFVQPYRCKNVLIEGITLMNSPAWVLHPVLCENVSVINVNINSVGPNNDGLDPESCNGVHIKDCVFHTGDDCIAIKSGKDHDGRRLSIPCENIVIRDCIFKNGHGAVGIGSEISGGVRSVFAENCMMSSPELDRVIRLKTNTIRGGFIENVYVRNCVVVETRGSVLDIEMFYYDQTKKGKHYTKIKNIELENISSKKSKHAIKITGSDSIPVENVKIKNCKFENVKNEDIIEGVKDLRIINDNALQSNAFYPLGTAVSLKLLKEDAKYRKIIVEEFGSLTAESVMKMRYMWPKEEKFCFADSDYLVDFALKYGKRLHGHNLLWGSVPDWVFKFEGDSARLENILKKYISTVVSYYKGRILSWDVVNEMIDDEGEIKKDNIWIKYLGEGCIERAFVYAHEADPDALLFYNDYGHEYSEKRLRGIIGLINTLKGKKIPVHGIGLQMHTRHNLEEGKWKKAIITAASTGLLVHISELDISLNPAGDKDIAFTEKLAEQQREKYKYILNVYNDIPGQQQYGVTFWGVGDNHTWIRTYEKRQDWPLLFDDNYKRKPAYYGVTEAFTR